MELGRLGIVGVGKGYNLLQALDVRATFIIGRYRPAMATSRIRFSFLSDIARWL